MYHNSPSSVEQRARQSFFRSEEETRKKQLYGEDKLVRAMAIQEEKITCMVTPRTAFSGSVKVEWLDSKETRMEGTLNPAPGASSQHLQIQSGPDFYQALQEVVTMGPVPIKVFCDHPNPMQSVQAAMNNGLKVNNSLLGHLFCSKDSLYYSNLELPPRIGEGNKYQHSAYELLRNHRVALVQGLPGSGKSRLMLEVLKVSQHLQATWLAETNQTIELLAHRALKAGLAPVIMLAKGRGSPKNQKLQYITVESLAKEHGCSQFHVITSTPLLILTNTLATTHRVVLNHRHSDILLIDECGMIPSYRYQGLRTLKTTHLIMCGDSMQTPPYQEPRGEFAHLLQDHPRLTVQLLVQYRMPPAISRLSNALAYNGEMKDGVMSPPPLPTTLPDYLRQRIILVDTNAQSYPHCQVGHSSMNPSHIDASLALYRILRESYPLESIQALSLYEAHANELYTAMIPCFHDAPHPLSISASQGSEFPVVLLNVVKTGKCRGFPENLNVINVGVSRAQVQLFIIADAEGLMDIPMWKTLRAIWLDKDIQESSPRKKRCKSNIPSKKRVKAGTVVQEALQPPYINWRGSGKWSAFQDHLWDHLWKKRRVTTVGGEGVCPGPSK